MKIYEILSDTTVEANIEVSSKELLLNVMIDMLAKTDKLKDKAKAKKEIFERERIMSTGVGKGIALPHAKTSVVDESIGALITLKSPLDFDSLDGNPVNIVFMLLGTEDDVGKHLKLLSKISRLMNNDSFRNKLIDSHSGSEILGTIIHFEDME